MEPKKSVLLVGIDPASSADITRSALRFCGAKSGLEKSVGYDSDLCLTD